MVDIIATLLSFNAVSALVPVAIIAALILAAAGLGRNKDLFGIFAVGTALGVGRGQGKGMAGKGIKGTKVGKAGGEIKIFRKKGGVVPAYKNLMNDNADRSFYKREIGGKSPDTNRKGKIFTATGPGRTSVPAAGSALGKTGVQAGGSALGGMGFATVEEARRSKGGKKPKGRKIPDADRTHVINITSSKRSAFERARENIERNIKSKPGISKEEIRREIDKQREDMAKIRAALLEKQTKLNKEFEKIGKLNDVLRKKNVGGKAKRMLIGERTRSFAIVSNLYGDIIGKEGDNINQQFKKIAGEDLFTNKDRIDMIRHLERHLVGVKGWNYKAAGKMAAANNLNKIVRETRKNTSEEKERLEERERAEKKEKKLEEKKKRLEEQKELEERKRLEERERLEQKEERLKKEEMAEEKERAEKEKGQRERND